MSKSFKTIVIFLCGALTSTAVLSAAFGLANSQFFDIKLKDILPVTATLIVGYYLSHLYSSNISTKNRQFGLQNSEITNIRVLLEDSCAASIEYMENPNRAQNGHINLRLKRLDAKLKNFNKIANKCGVIDAVKTGALYNDFKALRDLITGDSFGTGRMYSKSEIDRARRWYSLMQGKLDDFIFDIC